MDYIGVRWPHKDVKQVTVLVGSQLDSHIRNAIQIKAPELRDECFKNAGIHAEWALKHFISANIKPQ